MKRKKQRYNPKPRYDNLTCKPPCNECDKKSCNYRECLEYRVWFANEWAIVRERFQNYLKKEGDG